ncbi:hypothetical protein JCM19302_2493 [Jejuia pallidilutea]|nr:hypothetical protein JCM19302_2493 [Jejuia pallidilutea]
MTLIIILWKTYYLFNSGFKKNVFSDFWLIFIKHIMAFTFAYIAISYIYNKYLKTEILTFLDLILAGIKTNLLLLLIFVPVLVLFSKGFRDFSYRLKKYSPFS